MQISYKFKVYTPAPEQDTEQWWADTESQWSFSFSLSFVWIL